MNLYEEVCRDLGVNVVLFLTVGEVFRRGQSRSRVLICRKRAKSKMSVSESSICYFFNFYLLSSVVNSMFAGHHRSFWNYRIFNRFLNSATLARYLHSSRRGCVVRPNCSAAMAVSFPEESYCCGLRKICSYILNITILR